MFFLLSTLKTPNKEIKNHNLFWDKFQYKRTYPGMIMCLFHDLELHDNKMFSTCFLNLKDANMRV